MSLSVPAEPEAHPPGTLLAGKFRVERLLGAGGMGAVYAITHELTRHKRALKLLHPRFLEHKDVVDRFLREASAAGRIGDPHIVETFDAGFLPGGEPYLVLELLEGRSLADRLKGTAGLSVAESIELVAQACDGAQAANDAGIVHRDLKPDNLFLVEQGGRPFVKVLDFGVSKFDPKFTTDRATVGGAMIGTPYYMSPEQMRGELDLDARTDVYALGVILWECLTNSVPYTGNQLPVLVAQVLSDREPSLADVRPDLPRAIIDIAARAMRKPRDARIGSAGELAAALRALAGNLTAADHEAPQERALAATALPSESYGKPGELPLGSSADPEVDPIGATIGAAPAEPRRVAPSTSGPPPSHANPSTEAGLSRTSPSPPGAATSRGRGLAIGAAVLAGLAGVIAVSMGLDDSPASRERDGPRALATDLTATGEPTTTGTPIPATVEPALPSAVPSTTALPGLASAVPIASAVASTAPIASAVASARSSATPLPTSAAVKPTGTAPPKPTGVIGGKGEFP